ncbi:response regulator [Roseomonas sp. BN140053]|uniref:response regulator n=1 Tax=Roseomonas sp. BN140053 TaxID=3391898 RepID=UPI0039E97AA7
MDESVTVPRGASHPLDGRFAVGEMQDGSGVRKSVFDVLVLDDDDLVRATLVSILEAESWTVREASEANEAIALMSVPDCCRVLVTDLDLGTTLTGFDVVQHARQRLPELPVLYVTGRPWLLSGKVLDEHERALAKPFRSDQFVAAVRSLSGGALG